MSREEMRAMIERERRAAINEMLSNVPTEPVRDAEEMLCRLDNNDRSAVQG